MKRYKVKHEDPETKAVYGLTELYRGQVKDAKILANPGCYTTCSILALVPLLKAGLIETQGIIIDAKSGTTGAGRGLKLGSLYCSVNENFHAYGVAGHSILLRSSRFIVICRKRCCDSIYTTFVAC